MDLEKLFRNHLSLWIRETGAEGDTVLSSRVRLARNLLDTKFTAVASVQEMEQVLTLVEETLPKLKRDLTLIRLAEVDSLSRQELVEKHLISPEHAENPQTKGVVVNPDEDISIMINEEDHLRIQVIKAGLSLKDTYELANQLDDELEELIPIAFSPKYGYLTSCPTNVGTGLRVSVMLHLPALVALGQIDRVSTVCSKLGLVIRGLYGEGSASAGDIFQISNQITLGSSESEIISHLQAVAEQIIEEERKARQALLEGREGEIEDHVYRALGLLTYARKLDSNEAMTLLSKVKLGIDLGLIKSLDSVIMKELMVITRSAVLQKIMGSSLTPEERDNKRAVVIREWIAHFTK